jgi:outer membrane protein assembly factor BamD
MGCHRRVMAFVSRQLGICLLVGSLMILPAGCGTSLSEFYFGDLFGGGKKVEKNPEQLAVEGMQKLQEKDYGDALKAFQQLKERYPYSKYAILAQIKVADAQFYKEEYADAAIAYEEFARLHPRNEIIPYVLYQIGMCHFLAFQSVDRDQDETRLAGESFQRLIQAFPQSEYALKAKKQLFECQKRLAAHEFNVSQFYYRQEKYQAAKDRLDRLVATYPQATQALGLDKEVQEMLVACNREVSKGAPKKSIWSRLGL